VSDSRKSRLVLLFALFASLSSVRAQADGKRFDDPYDVPAAPRPPTLPELTHSETEASLEATAGTILGTEPTHAYVQRLALEVPLGIRRWFVGANYELAAGGATGPGGAGGALRVASGNLELDGRTLWATHTGLAFGGGLGLMLPTAAASVDDATPSGKVALEAATLRPWDVGFFVANALGFRPFVDVRAVDGAFVAQFRQGIDLTVSTSGDRRVYANVGVYFGYWFTSHVAGGLEAFESYVIEAPHVSDGARAAVVVSPNVRLALPWVQPSISMFTSIGTPLQRETDRVWGFRFEFTVVYDPNAKLGVRTR
jgi:hypothetical protein